MKKQDNYSDIIGLPHHVSKNHMQMSREARAAQFAPFAALTGHEEAINETARLTDKREELSDEQKNRLDACLNYIIDNISSKPEVEITHFIPDKKKAGGMYVMVTGRVRRVDTVGRIIELDDRTKYSMDDIADICLTEK